MWACQPVPSTLICSFLLWRIAILASHFFLLLFFFFLSFVFLSIIRFILPRCCWSFVVLSSLVLSLSFLSFPVSSGLLYFSWEFFSLYLFILEGSDSLVTISGFRPLPGWGPPQDNSVYSFRPWKARMAAVKNPPSPFSLPHPPVGVRIGKLVAWESWARFVRELDTLALTIERWGLLSLSSGRPSGTGPSLFLMESNLRLRVAEFEAGYFLPFFFFFFFL